MCTAFELSWSHCVPAVARMGRVITREEPSMTEWGVIPSIRVQDMPAALAFYRGTLEFTLDSGDDAASNSSLTRGDAHVMIETAADLYGDEYNAAIRERLETFVHRPVHGGLRPHRVSLQTGSGRRTDHRSARHTAVGSGAVHR